MRNIFLNQNEYISTSDVRIFGTSNQNETVIINEDKNNIFISSTVDKIIFNQDITKFKFYQGFGSNLIIKDDKNNLIANITDIANKVIFFNEENIEFEYQDNNIFIENNKIEKVESSDTESIDIDQIPYKLSNPK